MMKNPLVGIASLLLAIVLSIATRGYYALVYLPEHHGSSSKAATQVLDFSGWFAFVTSATGAVLHGSIVLLIVIFFVNLMWRSRSRQDNR
jgi:hypothetical protein